MKDTVCLLTLVLILGGCESYPHHPVTQTAVPFYALNAANKKSAPNVTQNLAFERLRARSEPQNWLTYYGAYDGQRYSPLDEINTSNVKSRRPAWVFQYGVIGLVANPATYSSRPHRSSSTA